MDNRNAYRKPANHLQNLCHPGSLVRVGLIGAGGIAAAHALSLGALPGITIAAVSDPAVERAHSFAKLFGIPRVCRSHSEMLGDEPLDVVHVLTPPDSHVAIALDAIRAGCDVFVEKPLGLSTVECRELHQEASRLARSVGVNHSDAHAPAFRRLLDVIASRRLGRINHMAVTYAAPAEILPVRDPGHYVFRSPGNVAFEFGPHPFSMIRLVMGELKQMSTVATGEVKVGAGGYYHSWLCSMTCARGTAQLIISLGRGLKETTTHVVGQDGMAFADSRRGILQVYESTPHALTENVRSALANSVHALAYTAGSVLGEVGVKLKLRRFATPNGFSDSIKAFYTARANKQPVAEDSAAGLEVVRFCEEAIASQAAKKDGT